MGTYVYMCCDVVTCARARTAIPPRTDTVCTGAQLGAPCLVYSCCIATVTAEPDSIEDVSEELSWEVFSIISLSLVVDELLRAKYKVRVHIETSRNTIHACMNEWVKDSDELCWPHTRKCTFCTLVIVIGIYALCTYTSALPPHTHLFILLVMVHAIGCKRECTS